MKKQIVIALCLVVLLAFALVGCGGDNETTQSPSVAPSTSPMVTNEMPSTSPSLSPSSDLPLVPSNSVTPSNSVSPSPSASVSPTPATTSPDNTAQTNGPGID